MLPASGYRAGVRQLLPVAAEVDPMASPRGATPRADRPGRPWVALNMVASIDGATAVDGRVRRLGRRRPTRRCSGPSAAVADVILVAAGTVRAEAYGPPRTSAGRCRSSGRLAARRRSHGWPVVTASLDLDPTAALFTEAPEPPIVLTAEEAPQERQSCLQPVADIVRVGHGGVDLPLALAHTAPPGPYHRGLRGRPELNGQLLAAGLIDEVNVTIAPTLAGGASGRLAIGGAETPTTMDLAHLWFAEGVLLARYVRSAAGRS
jgi:riboflavin biosynthesis pyrimidine reductase